jgi:hypothetical protein
MHDLHTTFTSVFSQSSHAHDWTAQQPSALRRLLTRIIFLPSRASAITINSSPQSSAGDFEHRICLFRDGDIDMHHYQCIESWSPRTSCRPLKVLKTQANPSHCLSSTLFLTPMSTAAKATVALVSRLLVTITRVGWPSQVITSTTLFFEDLLVHHSSLFTIRRH